MGGQDHFYLETQVCLVLPSETGEVEVFSSTQNPTASQVYYYVNDINMQILVYAW